MPYVSKSTNVYPKSLTGTIVLTGTPTTQFTVGRWVYVGTWASPTFKAKVVKAKGNVVTVKNITGTLASANTLKERNDAGTGDTSATEVVATVTSGTLAGTNISYNTGGWNLRQTANGIVRTRRSGSRIIAEVVVAIARYNSKTT